jgi:hypothetical protein
MLAWLREDEGARLLAAVNFAAVLAPLRLPAEPPRTTLLISTDPERADGDVDLNGFMLGPSEAVLLRL